MTTGTIDSLDDSTGWNTTIENSSDDSINFFDYISYHKETSGDVYTYQNRGDGDGSAWPEFGEFVTVTLDVGSASYSGAQVSLYPDPDLGGSSSFVELDPNGDVRYGWIDDGQFESATANGVVGSGGSVWVQCGYRTGPDEFLLRVHDSVDGTLLFSDERSLTSAPGSGTNYYVESFEVEQISWASGESIDYTVDDLGSGTIPPRAPSNLSATAAAPDQIDLSWTDNSNSEDGFTIYRAQSSGSTVGDYTQVDSVGANTTSYSDKGLSGDTTYYYRVSATDGSTESDLSNEASDATPLAAPTLDTLDASVEDEITVEWTKNDGSGDGEFEVWRSTDDAAYSRVADGLAPSTTSWTDSGLPDGEKYWYFVRRIGGTGATNDSGTLSAVTILPVPTGLQVDSVDGDQITISWTDNADNEAGYRVELSRDGGSTWTQDGGDLPAGTESYQTTNLLDGERYQLRVRAFSEHTSALDATNFDVAPGTTYTFAKPLTVEDSQFDKPLDNGGVVQPNDTQ